MRFRSASTFQRALFLLAHEAGDRSFHSTYRKTIRNESKPYDELKREQEKQLRALIAFSYDQVPYYRSLFNDLGLRPGDIRTVDDLEKLPVLTKETIKANWEGLKPATLSSMAYSTRATGGSTGNPMQYRISNEDRFLGGALLYRGWGYGGYGLGDRMVLFMGSPLLVRNQPRSVTRVHERVRNIRKFSAHDMGGDDMQQYAGVLSSFRPRFLRGYPSSIYFFAQWLAENDAAIPPLDAVFTTGEPLFPHIRATIGETFNCETFDNYGLNDGGVSAYECPEHSGLHIDTERSILEVVDQGKRQLDEGKGEILATSLHNFALPFIRYATGDVGTLADRECDCGRHTKLLSEVMGRTADILVTPEGKNVHGLFFNQILYESGIGIKEYQVIQTAIDDIRIAIVPDIDFDEKKVETIRKRVAEKSPNWNVECTIAETIDRTRMGKFRYIINDVASNAG